MPRRLLLLLVCLLVAPVLATGAPKPVTLHFDPPSIPAERLTQRLGFVIEVSGAAARPPVQVELSLSAGGPEHTYRAVSEDGHTFLVSAAPLAAGDPLPLRITLIDADSEATFVTGDRDLVVNGKSIPLHGVRTIDVGSPSEVILQDGTRLTGKVTGLEALEGMIAGTNVRFNPQRAVRLLVGRAEPGPPRITFHIVARSKGRVVAEQRGVIPITATTLRPPTTPMKVAAPLAFSPARSYPVPAAMALATADLDGDRRLDVVVAAGDELGVLYGVGDGTLEPYKRILPWKGSPAHLAIADIDGDGHPDLLFVDRIGRLVITPNLGGRRFGEERMQMVGGANALRVADFNRDGRLDLALASGGPSRGWVKIMLQQPDGTFKEGKDLSLPGWSDGLAVGDINGDGIPDVAGGFLTSTVDRSGAALFIGDGTGEFHGGEVHNVGTQNMPGVTLADFNGDGKLDLAITGYWGGQIVVLFNKGDGTFGSLLRYPVDQYPIQIEVADFDGDGKPDLAVPSAGKGQVSILRNRGDGTFRDAVVFPDGGENSRGCAAIDLNRDGRPDLVVQNENSRSITVLLNASGK